MEPDKKTDDFSSVSFSKKKYSTKYRMWPYVLGMFIEIMVFKYVGLHAGLIGIVALTGIIFGAAWLFVKLLGGNDQDET